MIMFYSVQFILLSLFYSVLTSYHIQFYSDLFDSMLFYQIL